MVEEECEYLRDRFYNHYDEKCKGEKWLIDESIYKPKKYVYNGGHNAIVHSDFRVISMLQ